MIENDSIGFELLRRSVSDTASLIALCSCIVRDDAIGLRLAYLYYGFMQLKYYWGVGGTIEGISFSTNNRPGKRPDKKIWRQTLSQFKMVVQRPIPYFRDYLYGSSFKLWD